MQLLTQTHTCPPIPPIPHPHLQQQLHQVALKDVAEGHPGEVHIEGVQGGCGGEVWRSA